MYVPKILAMADMIRNADQYNVTLPVLANKPQLRDHQHRWPDRSERGGAAGGHFRLQLKALGPALKRGVTSPRGPYNLLVPVEYADTLELALADLPQRERTRGVRSYQVTSGDTPSRIAQNHGVSVQQLKLANNLRGNNLRRGQSLIIPNGGKAMVSQTARASRSNWRAAVAARLLPGAPGDNLWSISQAHVGHPRRSGQVERLNAKSSLKPGMKLVVWPKARQGQQQVHGVPGCAAVTLSIAARFPGRRQRRDALNPARQERLPQAGSGADPVREEQQLIAHQNSKIPRECGVFLSAFHRTNSGVMAWAAKRARMGL